MNNKTKRNWWNDVLYCVNEGQRHGTWSDSNSKFLLIKAACNIQNSDHLIPIYWRAT